LIEEEEFISSFNIEIGILARYFGSRIFVIDSIKTIPMRIYIR
jgi:hypothetical protein